ncbi:MAG: ABC transporter ATP-binding protein [Bacteroidetes bacterium]|nr:ABC transporter ATP-binding protein [Bacteroidota bacterium]
MIKTKNPPASSDSAAPLIEFKNLNWSYGDNTVLEGINSIINHGEFTSIIGPNGSGKTTLLKHIFRLLPPTSGQVFLDSKDILSYSRKALAREAGLVPQNEKGQYLFTVNDLIKMGRYAHTGRFTRETKHDTDIIAEAMEMTSIMHLKDKIITELSGGEFQRVIISRALAQEPHILALDEPTTYLDPHHQVEILQLLKKLIAKRNISVICTLHDLNSTLAFSDRTLLLNNGKIQFVGTPEKVLTAENIKKIYNLNALILANPLTGKSMVAIDSSLST